jgi:hypothetical protein
MGAARSTRGIHGIDRLGEVAVGGGIIVYRPRPNDGFLKK